MTERRKLTDRTVKGARLGDRRRLIWDDVIKGFALSVEPSGHRSYKLVYRRGGRVRWYTIGDARRLPLVDARKTAKDLNARMTLEPDFDPQSDRRRQVQAGTFEELARRYLKEHAKRRLRSWRQSEYKINRYLLPRWGSRQASAITYDDVLSLHDDLTRRGSPVAANQAVAQAGAVFGWAVKRRLVDGNPARGIERNKTHDRERVLSELELPTWWPAFDEAGPVAGAALRCILLTGQRPGEVRHLHTRHLERVDGGAWWRLPGEADAATGWPGTKNGQSHAVWLPARVLTLIDDVAGGRDGLVFAGKRGRPIGNLHEAMRAVREMIELEAGDKVTPHDLRRTHGTLVTGLGFTRDQMNRLQNHKEGGIGSVYDRHHYRDENRRIQEAVVAKVLRLVGKKSQGSVVAFRR